MKIIIYKAGISSGLFQVAGSLKKKTFYKEMGQEKYEKIYKPDFVLPKKCLLFIYILHYCKI